MFAASGFKGRYLGRKQWHNDGVAAAGASAKREKA